MDSVPVGHILTVDKRTQYRLKVIPSALLNSRKTHLRHQSSRNKFVDSLFVSYLLQKAVFFKLYFFLSEFFCIPDSIFCNNSESQITWINMHPQILTCHTLIASQSLTHNYLYSNELTPHRKKNQPDHKLQFPEILHKTEQIEC